MQITPRAFAWPPVTGTMPYQLAWAVQSVRIPKHNASEAASSVPICCERFTSNETELSYRWRERAWIEMDVFS
jgi:hypothetical protein